MDQGKDPNVPSPDAVVFSSGNGGQMPEKVTPSQPAVCPERDGSSADENTKQLRWIAVLFGNLSALFRDRPDVFVGADLLWYPVEGEPDLRTAPDVFVVFGRPKGDRGSYKQWEEHGVPLTVVFEILSPSNTGLEMVGKLSFYDEAGVEECYLYDPDTNLLMAFVRQGQVLRRIRPVDGFVSPRLKIRFDLSGPEMIIYHPDGRKFSTFEELEAERVEAVRQTAEARQQAAEARQQATEAQRRAARLVELGRKVRQGQANPEELQELQRLEEQSLPAPPP